MPKSTRRSRKLSSRKVNRTNPIKKRRSKKRKVSRKSSSKKRRSSRSKRRSKRVKKGGGGKYTFDDFRKTPIFNPLEFDNNIITAEQLMVEQITPEQIVAEKIYGTNWTDTFYKFYPLWKIIGILNSELALLLNPDNVITPEDVNRKFKIKQLKKNEEYYKKSLRNLNTLKEIKKASEYLKCFKYTYTYDINGTEKEFTIYIGQHYTLTYHFLGYIE